MRSSHTLALTLSALILASCGGGEASSEALPACDPGADSLEVACYEPWRPFFPPPEPETCQVSLCLTGAIDQNSGSNTAFQSICEHEPIPGLVEDCERGRCYSSFDSFIDGTRRTIYPALFAALDSNDDGRLDDQDEPCQINLLAFSWGGPTALELADRLATDERVAAPHGRIARLLVLDPYRPNFTLEMPPNVEMARVWRQSASPADDCSRWSIGGPYRGLPLSCPPHADCQDVDISALEDDVLRTSRRDIFAIEPDQVGHCEVPLVARDWIMDALFDLEDFGGKLGPLAPSGR
jgi:hypothetical protein